MQPQLVQMKKVLALGNALTDILMQVSDEQVLSLGLEKGSMNHISLESARYIQDRFATVRKSMIAGGSASNTVNALASLGIPTAFIGKIGNDEIGEFFRQNAERNGVRPILMPSRLMSGNCIALITPDGERTFATYLGAAANLKPENIMPDMFEGYNYFHIEGYIVQNHELIEKAVRLAKEAGLIVSLDLASFNVVNENRDFLTDLVEKYVQNLFAKGECHAVIGIGGAGGTQICTKTMRSMPIGLPKLMMSTLAAGNMRWYVGDSDISMFPSITDVAGINCITQMVFDRFRPLCCGQSAR